MATNPSYPDHDSDTTSSGAIRFWCSHCGCVLFAAQSMTLEIEERITVVCRGCGREQVVRIEVEGIASR